VKNLHLVSACLIFFISACGGGKQVSEGTSAAGGSSIVYCNDLDAKMCISTNLGECTVGVKQDSPCVTDSSCKGKCTVSMGSFETTTYFYDSDLFENNGMCPEGSVKTSSCS
jgi:hypothetical protein